MSSLIAFLSFFSAFVSAVELKPLGSSDAKKGGDFKFNLRVQPETLNPLIAHDNYAADCLPWMVETLLSRDEETYEWVPRLAESYRVLKGGKEIVFKLRKGVRFHNGRELTSRDVKFSIDAHMVGLYGKSTYSTLTQNLVMVDMPDDHTVKVKMKKPLFSNLQIVAGLPIVPKVSYQDTSKKAELAATVIGSGPYRLKENQSGVRLILEANPDWWGRKLPYFKNKYNFNRIIVRFVNEEELKMQMLEKGDLDYSEMTLSTFLSRVGAPPWNATVFAEKVSNRGIATTQASVFWNLRNSFFQDRRVRVAMQKLLNRDLLNQKFRGGLSQLATGPWHRFNDSADRSLEPVKFDPEGALALLKEAGWADTDKDGFLDKEFNKRRLTLRWTLLLPGKDWERYFTVYQEDLKKAGVKLDIQILDWPAFVKKIDSKEYEAYMVGRGWPGVIDFNPKAEWNSKNIERGENNIGYSNLEVDTILEKAEVEMNRAKRLKLMQQAYRLIAADQSQLFVFSDPFEFYGRAARLKKPKDTYTYNMGLDYWWIEDGSKAE